MHCIQWISPKNLSATTLGSKTQGFLVPWRSQRAVLCGTDWTPHEAKQRAIGRSGGSGPGGTGRRRSGATAGPGSGYHSAVPLGRTSDRFWTYCGLRGGASAAVTLGARPATTAHPRQQPRVPPVHARGPVPPHMFGSTHYLEAEMESLGVWTVTLSVCVVCCVVAVVAGHGTASCISLRSMPRHHSCLGDGWS